MIELCCAFRCLLPSPSARRYCISLLSTDSRTLLSYFAGEKIRKCCAPHDRNRRHKIQSPSLETSVRKISFYWKRLFFYVEDVGFPRKILKPKRGTWWLKKMIDRSIIVYNNKINSSNHFQEMWWSKMQQCAKAFLCAALREIDSEVSDLGVLGYPRRQQTTRTQPHMTFSLFFFLISI